MDQNKLKILHILFCSAEPIWQEGRKVALENAL